MKTVLITGVDGFVGRNLRVALDAVGSCKVIGCDIETPRDELEHGLAMADVVVHLAGVNRPREDREFEEGNAGFTDELCATLEGAGRSPLMIFASSIQAALDNPYGRSKRQAEDRLKTYAARTGAAVTIFRFKNIFGKWCRPNYNSVVATFCHNIAHDLPLVISDPSRELELVYIDDVVRAIMDKCSSRCRSGVDGKDAAVHSRHYDADDRQGEARVVAGACPDPGGISAAQATKNAAETAATTTTTTRQDGQAAAVTYADVWPVYTTTLGALADAIRGFRESRVNLMLPDMGNAFVQALYSTYLTYLEPEGFAYGLNTRTDNRGALAEFIRTRGAGQVFVSRTKPGIVRGNHYHHTKTEKFLVMEGEAVIRLRQIRGDAVVERRVSGGHWEVVDIPPGYTHSIGNIGTTDLITLFWASETFDPEHPDTYACAV